MRTKSQTGSGSQMRTQSRSRSARRLPRFLIKLGGAALQDPVVSENVCRDLKRLRNAGFEIIVVHGGGPRINQELVRRGIQWNFINGQRVTTPEMMEVIEMVLCGQVNREIVRSLQRIGVNAMGVSGVDARLLECRQLSPELGQVGKIQNVNASWIESLLGFRDVPKDESVFPVIAPIGIGRNGEAYNINADWAASYLAEALSVDRLIFVTDQNGILGQKGELLETISSDGLDELMRNQVVQGGMLAKAGAIQFALLNGISRVVVLNGKEPEALIQLVLDKKKLGTECFLRPELRPDELGREFGSEFESEFKTEFELEFGLKKRVLKNA